MSAILSIETSTTACSVALAINEQVIQRYALAPREHAQLILPWVESLLAEAGLRLNQLDAIAVGRGPGAFTGIRIGVGVAQGLAFGADLPVIPVSSLQILAQTAYAKSQCDRVLVAQDARMNEVYWAGYRLAETGLMISVIDDQISLAEKVQLPLDDQSWFAVGDAWQVYQQALTQHMSGISFKEISGLFPEAQYLSILATQLFSQGQSVAPEEALPVYLRGKEAWKLTSSQ
jgi:tRNA threonylcarbamoyladenosine biosynthesis protein TsaB